MSLGRVIYFHQLLFLFNTIKVLDDGIWIDKHWDIEIAGLIKGYKFAIIVGVKIKQIPAFFYDYWQK